MNKISSLETIVKSFRNIKGESGLEVFDFLKKVTGGYGTDLSPIVYKGENIKRLITGFNPESAVIKLKKPSITVNGRSRVKGQGIFGISVKDGNKQILTSALGVDLTRGEPILQLRGSLGNGTEKAVRFNSILNANNKGKDVLRYDLFFDEKIAEQLGFPKSAIQKFKRNMQNASKEFSPELSEEMAGGIRALFENKGFMPASIDRCMPILVKIASQKGEVTEKSARKCFNLLLKHMGYNPKNVKLKFLDENAEGSGMFDTQTGELFLKISKLKNFQDLAAVMGHEATHMEDFIILYKNLGPDKFKKLIGFDKFNQNWYEKMSKNVSAKLFAFEYKGKPTSIIFEDGTCITDPKKIKEFIECYPDTPRYNLQVIKKELNNQRKLFNSNLSGQYEKMHHCSDYIVSAVEGHARQTEINLRSSLKESGVFRKTNLSSKYGKAPGLLPERYSMAFAKIDKALNKYGKSKCAKFNELYEESLRTIDPELADIKVKLDKLAAQNIRTQETINLQMEYDKRLKNYYSEELLELKVMKEMQRKLGLSPNTLVQEMESKLGLEPCPQLEDIIGPSKPQLTEKKITDIINKEAREQYNKALTKVDPELGKIQELLNNGVHPSKLKGLEWEFENIVKLRYGDRRILDAKVHKEMKNEL